MSKNKKELDSELNLIAFISLLSVLICALLLTAIWVQIGSMDVKQAVGAASEESQEKTPSIWATFSKQGDVVLHLRDAKVSRRLIKKRFQNVEGKLNVEAIHAHVELLKNRIPTLRTALVKPQAETLYEDIIELMDQFKSAGIIDLGVSPL